MSELPTGWVKAALDELAEFSPKHETGIGLETEVSFVPMPSVCEYSGEIIAHETRQLAAVVKGYTHFKNGDVLFAKITPCMENGKAAIARSLVNGLGYGSTEFHVMRPSNALKPEFLWRFLRQEKFREEAAQVMTGAVGQRRVPTTFLKAYSFPVPPAAEQRRIVAKLDALDARAKRARADLDRIPALVARAKQAILAGIFEGPTAEQFPKLQIQQFASVGTGATPKAGEPRYYVAGSVPWVTSSVVNKSVVDEPSALITEAALQETNCKVFPIGTILLAMYGEGKTRGKCCVLGIAAATNQALAAIQIKEASSVLPGYLLQFLRGRYEKTRLEAAGGVQPNLNLGIVKAMEVPIPPISEQAEIVRRIESAFQKIDRIAADAASATKLLGRLDQAILTRAFRGELVPQNPEDEPASSLLERIAAARQNAPKSKKARKTGD